MKTSSTPKVRQYRSKIGALMNAGAKNQAMRTLSFPLAGETTALDFSQLSAQYNVTDGVTDGSLFGYFTALHQHGFALFENAAQATVAERAISYQPGDALLSKALGPGCRIRFADLLVRIQKLPRSTGGKDNRFVAEVVAREWCETLFGEKLPEELPPADQENLRAFADALCARFSGWRELSSDCSTALEVVADWLHAQTGVRVDLAGVLACIRERPDHIRTAPVAFVGAKTLNGDPKYVLQRIVQRYLSEGVEPRDLSSKITTPNANALSWLFGVGLGYFRETPLDTVMKDFGVPKARQADIKAVLDATLVIEMPSAFGLEHYSVYRTAFGQKIDGWVSNYLNRIDEWRRAVADIPAEPSPLPAQLGYPQARPFFTGLDVDFEQLQESLRSLHAEARQLPGVLAALAGDAEIDAPLDDVLKRVEKFIEQQSHVTSRLRMLGNRLEQEAGFAKQDGDEDRLAFVECCRFYRPSINEEGSRLDLDQTPSSWMHALGHNPTIGGGVPQDVQPELDTLASNFNIMLAAAREHEKRLADWLVMQGKCLDPVAELAERERRNIARRVEVDLVRVGTPEARARRNIIGRFMNQVRFCPDPIRRPITDALRATRLLDDKLLNKMVYNQQSIAFYKALFSRDRHDPVAVDETVLLANDWMRWISDQVTATWALVQAWQGSATKVPMRVLVQAAIRLERVASSIRLSGLPDVEYPGALATPACAQDALNLPVGVRLQIQQDHVRAETIAKVINAYASWLNGESVAMFRPSFYLRTRFQHVGGNGLFYVPCAEREWRIPEGWRKEGAETPLRAFADEIVVYRDNGSVDLMATFARIHAYPLTAATREFMRQCPHKWYLQTGLPVGDTVTGWRINKNFKRDGARLGAPRSGQAMRMVGLADYKNLLDLGLLTDARISWGDLTLLVEQSWLQEVVLQDGVLALSARPAGVSLACQLPVTDHPVAAVEGENFWDRLVAIDLGERSIGYAVYDCMSGQLLEPPAEDPVEIRQIYALIQVVKRFRNSVQPRQKFGSKYDTRLEKARETVTGAVVAEIIKLCRRYNAFPLLESTVGNLESGAQQLSRVYQRVLQHFLFSNVKAQNSYREWYWYGGKKHRHPYLRVRKNRPDGAQVDQGGRGRREVVEPLNLFPGAGVAPAGTSQRCSKCGVNPYHLLDQLHARVSYTVSNGRLQLPDGQVLVLENNAGQGMHRLVDGQLKVDDIRKCLRRSLRRPQPKQRQQLGRRDTTQSWYCCAMEGCRHQMHADQNAAVNIGWKFFHERVVR